MDLLRREAAVLAAEELDDDAAGAPAASAFGAHPVEHVIRPCFRHDDNDTRSQRRASLAIMRVLLLVVLLALAGCGGGSGDGLRNRSSPPSIRWPGRPNRSRLTESRSSISPLRAPSLTTSSSLLGTSRPFGKHTSSSMRAAAFSPRSRTPSPGEKGFRSTCSTASPTRTSGSTRFASPRSPGDRPGTRAPWPGRRCSRTSSAGSTRAIGAAWSDASAEPSSRAMPRSVTSLRATASRSSRSPAPPRKPSPGRASSRA